MSGYWTRTPNIILETVADMGKAELRLTMLLVRMTYGRNKSSIQLTYDEMQAQTGLSRGSVSKAISLIESRGFFQRGRKSTWQAVQKVEESSESELKSNNGIVQKVDQNSLKSELKSSKNSLKSELKIGGAIEIENIEHIENNYQPTVDNTPPRKKPNEQQKMIGVLCQVTHKDVSLNGKRYAKLASELVKNGYSPDEISNWYSSGGWYYKNDWRGKKGQVPNESAIRETVKLAKEGGITINTHHSTRMLEGV